ncbi:MAG: gfo/Idh/MocA family oxidoreductase, partial [Chloroflexota bacterium]
VDMFTDMFDAMDEGREPMETLYDGYVVNAIMDACYRSSRSRAWEPVDLDWRGGKTEPIGKEPELFEGLVVIKRELLPDGRSKLILKDPKSGDFTDRVV